jgi:hypothetical protein
MVNKLLAKRLQAIRGALSAAHLAGGLSSSASRGVEREHFLNSFLREVLPPPYRFGCGDITDRYGNRSGQMDIVVEYPFLPSLPFCPGGPRLYLAEGVAAVIEVKSNLQNQWPQVLRAVEPLRKLKRSLEGALNQIGDMPSDIDIPYFVVGYRGWKTLSPLLEHVQDIRLDGALVIDSGLYVSSARFGDHDQKPLELEGDRALWGLITSIHRALTLVQTTDFRPDAYL